MMQEPTAHLWQDMGTGVSSPLDIEAFAEICADPLNGVNCEHAADVASGVPVYDGDEVRTLVADPDSAALLASELAAVLGDGPGVVMFRNAWPDHDVLDAMTSLLWEVLDAERESGDGFDHFAANGANSRAWDVLGKCVKRDPSLHVRYYGNPVLHAVSTAWLGPWYQPTAQVNVVHPGGAAQFPHRDYHLGFLSDADAQRFPPHVHRLSQALTLQGIVAHTDMPVEAGSTMLLPGSQRFAAGYLAWRDERFSGHFHEHMVQVPLNPGDAVFFNPGLHHGGGENLTADHDRMGNLLQVSSAFGVPMENIDWPAVAIATYPTLLDLARQQLLEDHHIATCASGYAFPTNLDTDTSAEGLAPPSSQALMRAALRDRVTPEVFAKQIAEQVQRRFPA